MSVKKENGYFAKKGDISRKICDVELIYGGIFDRHNRHIHTEISDATTKKNTLEIAEKPS